MKEVPCPEAEYRFMAAALELAVLARDAGEVPVGAVVVVGDTIVGRGYNSPVGRHDPTAHAEILAMREAAIAAGNYRLTGSTLYCTLEPCVMCLGAALHARIHRVVYAARDPKIGATGWMELLRAEGAAFNHRPAVSGGLKEAEAAAMMRAFFAERRSDARDGEVPKWS